jgi:hypothetical protein
MAQDSDTGVGTGDPISGGIGSGIGYLVPQVYTLLPLPDYAAIMGINPIQFMSATAPTLFPSTGCTDKWRQYAWQDDEKVSREELAYEIARAERDLAKELRYWPGRVFTEDEEVPYPQFHRKGYVGLYGHDANHRMKSAKLRYGKFISGGKREVAPIGTATTGGLGLAYEDNDGDGFEETARITVATSLTDACELKVYFNGKNGDKEWEIRPLKSKSISGGIFEATVDSWLLLDPELLFAFPGPNPTGFLDIDAEDLASYVTDVDVYREYVDPAKQCALLWEGADTCLCGGAGCSVCGYEVQTACLTARNELLGMVSPVPGVYDAGTGNWTFANFAQGYEPRKMKVNYLSGDSEASYNGCYRMARDLALAITYMTTARLSRPLCTDCVTLRKREEELKEDLIFITPGGDATRFITREVLNCPFGTKYGELEAWRIIKDRIGIGDRNVDVALV